MKAALLLCASPPHLSLSSRQLPKQALLLSLLMDEEIMAQRRKGLCRKSHRA